MRKKISPVFALIICCQSFILAVAFEALYVYTTNTYPSYNLKHLNVIILLTFILIIFVTFYGLVTVSSLSRKESTLEFQNLYLNDVNQLIQALKSQRHDFKNIIQTVYGLISIDCNNEAKEYLKSSIQELRELSRVTGFKVPVISSLLQAKVSIAKDRGIIFDINPLTDLANFIIDYYDLSRILGNLIDNAFEAVTAEKDNYRKVWLVVKEDQSSFIFEIGNLGPPIPEVHLEKVFEPGYSTKAGELRGMGLSIVKNLIKKNNGAMSLISHQDTGTIFTLNFSKNK